MEIRVPPEAAGERLDVVLADHVGSRTAAQRLIDAGLVTVDGAVKAKRAKVESGQLVAWEPPVEEPARAPDDVPFDIAYENDELLVVDKPAGVVVHPAPGHHGTTLTEVIPGARLVHRLDRDTSGLLIVAKTDAAHRRLKELLQKREIVREYLALVLGRPPARSGTIDAPIGRDRRHRTRMSTDTDTPREARTHFTIEETFPEATLLRVRRETGRTHQIRAHLTAIGHPVAGDPEYGGAGAFGLERQFLHAARLAFEDVEVTSPLPEDLQVVLAAQRHAGRPPEVGEGDRPARP